MQSQSYAPIDSPFLQSVSIHHFVHRFFQKTTLISVFAISAFIIGHYQRTIFVIIKALFLFCTKIKHRFSFPLTNLLSCVLIRLQSFVRIHNNYILHQRPYRSDKRRHSHIYDILLRRMDVKMYFDI